jgi:uncharacterized membrane protein
MGIKDFIQGKPLGHPSHPLFVHFPTALFPTSLAFDVVSWGLDEPALVRAAFYNIAAGIAVAALAFLTGFADYFGMIPGSRKHRVATWHWLLNVPMVLIFALGLGLRAPALDNSQTPIPLMSLSCVGVLLLMAGNYFGGELVYRLGMRVNTGRQRETPLLHRVVSKLPLLREKAKV